MHVLLRNSANDGRKGGKLQLRWSQSIYEVVNDLGKGCFQLKNCETGLIMKKAVNSSRLKRYFKPTDMTYARKEYGSSSLSKIEVCYLLPYNNIMYYINTV